MGKKELDKIYIRDLSLRCIIGINDDERIQKQDIIINITLFADLKKACMSDDINDTVDYKSIKKNILSLVETSSFFLVEKLAEEISKICFNSNMVKKVKVCVDKPGALRFSKSAAVEITRYNL